MFSATGYRFSLATTQVLDDIAGGAREGGAHCAVIAAAASQNTGPLWQADTAA